MIKKDLGYQPHTRKGTTLIKMWTPQDDMTDVSISQADLDAGCPKDGDVIARANDNPNDRWLINKEYYKENYKIAVGFHDLMGEALNKP